MLPLKAIIGDGRPESAGSDRQDRRVVGDLVTVSYPPLSCP
ncbi:MAG: hypothetical protein V5B40_24220 [Candidatus Accumulibacter meliphilus]